MLVGDAGLSRAISTKTGQRRFQGYTDRPQSHDMATPQPKINMNPLGRLDLVSEGGWHRRG